MKEEVIKDAIKSGKDIEFYYTKYSGELSKRRVSKISFSNEFGEFGYVNDHIKGFCNLRKEERTFRISRMSNVKLTSPSSSNNTVPTNSVNSRSGIGENSTPTKSYRELIEDINKLSYTVIEPPRIETKKEGCYIATMVYGDYDHPKVLLLRSFRDEVLAKTLVGKAFIALYYYTSPILVKKLRNKQNVNRFLERILDIIIKKIGKWVG